MIRKDNKFSKLASPSITIKTFLALTHAISPSFFKQSSQNKAEHYKSEFLIFQRAANSLDWGFYALNGRKFTDENGYPDGSYRALLDFILLEFGGMP